MEPWPSDVHIMIEWEDLYHAPTPDCPCKPRFVGFSPDGKRVFEHNEVEPLH